MANEVQSALFNVRIKYELVLDGQEFYRDIAVELM